MATLSHALGVILADRDLLGVETALVLAAGGIVVGLLLRGVPGVRAFGAVVALGSCGALAMASQHRQAALAPLEEPREALVDGTVCARHARGRSYSIDLCDCVVGTPGASRLPRKLRVFAGLDPASRNALEGLRRGERIRARLWLTPIRQSANPGVGGSAKSYVRRGIGARANLREAAMLVRLPGRDRFGTSTFGVVRAAVARWRRCVGERLSAEGPGGGFIRALALGDRSTLPGAAREAFARAGIGHLLAVSGLHVALVAGLAFAIVRRACLRSVRMSVRHDPRRIALMGAFLCALVYAAMSGWGIPVRRAVLFLAVVCLAVASRRTVGGVQLLCLAALPLLVAEPHALFEMGAQLSFIASAGLLLARREAGAGSTGIAAVVRTSATAIAATAPWVAWHGGSVGLFAVVANLFAVPWVGLVILPASLAAAVAAALPETVPTALVIAGASRLAEVTLNGVISVSALLPASSAGSTPSLGVLFCAGGISLLALWVRTTRDRVALCLAASALLVHAPAQTIEPAAPRVVSFDVGQGDATVVQGRSGSLLVDGGRAFGDSLDMGRRVVVPGLAALGVNALDLVVASHADIDHRGGLAAVIERVPTRELWLPRGASGLSDFHSLLEVAARRGVEVRERGRGDAPQVFGDLRVIPLWPPADGAANNRNDASLVIRVEVQRDGEAGESVLLVGDIGIEAERKLIEGGTALRSTVLKVGHHGSRGSSSPSFLTAVRPAIALVSAPCNGRAGLPTASAMDRLARSGAQVWWTGRSGAVIVGLTTHGRLRVAEGWHPNVQCLVH